MRKFLQKAVERAGFVLAVFALLWIGFSQGFEVSGFTVEVFGIILDVVFMNAFSATVLFLGFVAVSGFGVIVELFRQRKNPNLENSGEPLSVIIPVYKDSRVLERAVESAKNSNYQPIRVKIVYEEDDSASRKEAKRLEKKYEEVDALEN